MPALLSELSVLGDLCVEIFSCFCFFRSRMSRPAVHLFLREPDLRQDAANILRNKILEFADRMAENAARELFQVAGSNAKLFGKEPLAGLCNHEMHARHARVFL